MEPNHSEPVLSASTPLPQRREFLKRLAATLGTTAILTEMPWWQPLSAQPAGPSPSDRVRIGILGIGDRGSLHLAQLLLTPGVEIAALCDDYPPNLQRAQAKVPSAKAYSDYRQLFNDPTIDGVIIAVPLYLHAQMVLAAFAAHKHVYCEKSLAFTIDECQSIADAYRGSSKVFQIGHQRLYSPAFLRAYDLVHSGAIGQVTQIRAYWHRNGNWRRPVPTPDPGYALEHRINWRMYRPYSLGLMAELASHHLQVANWYLHSHPLSVVGYGAINYWKDGRQLYDTVNTVYRYPNGVHVVYDSLISNRFYGLELQVMGPKGTIEAETGKLYLENPHPAPGIVQLINQIEHNLFDTIPIGGASWAPDLKKDTKGTLLVPGKITDDGTALALAAFANAIRQNKPIPGMMEQACYSAVAVCMGQQAMEQGKEVPWPTGFRT